MKYMSSQFRTTLFTTLVVLFVAFGGVVPVHAELPACIKALRSLKQVGTDTNLYSANFEIEGTIQLYISNNRYIVMNGVDKGRKGTWSCDASGKVKLVLDPVATGGQSGGTVTATNGQPGGTQVTSSQDDFPLMIKLKNPLKVNTIQEAIKLFMDAVVKIAIPFIVVFFIWSGISFILAQGKPEAITKAKNMFWYTVIGTLLILGAWTITDAIVGTINSFAS